MSDLKDLAWTVQSTVTDPDFGTIVRRAHRRRTRRHAITAAATATATAVVAVAAVTATGPPRDRTGDPATTVPPPAQTSPLPPLRSGRDIVFAANAKLDGVALTSKDRWLATWRSCNADESDCQWAVAARDGDRWATSSAHREPIGVLEVDSKLSGFIPPPEGNNGPDGPTVTVFTGPGLLLSQDGTRIRETRLTPGPPVTTFDAEDVLLADGAGPWVVDPAERTVHRLALPSQFPGETRFGGITRDRTGRVWLTAGDPVGYLLWSDDGGRHWSKVALGTDAWAASFAVSPDGRTVSLATQLGRPDWKFRISRDAGQSWRQLRDDPKTPIGAAALDDGTVLLARGKNLYRIGTDLVIGDPAPLGGDIDRLGVSGDTVYAQLKAPNMVMVRVENGWTGFEPR